MIRTLVAEMAWAVRLAQRRPGAAISVAATLALAIAATTAAHAVASAILWAPLPFRDAPRLAFLWEERTEGGDVEFMRVTSGRYAEWRDRTRSFSSIAAFGASGFTIDDQSGATPVRGVRVAPAFFRTMGIAPLIGRDFEPADETPGQHFVVMLSHALWNERFGGRPDAIGETLRLSGQPYTVIGVMPPVVFPAWPVNPAVVTLDDSSRQLWTPIPRTPAFEQNMRSHLLGVVARLNDGVTLEQASAELASLQSDASADPHGGRAAPFRDQFVRDARLPLLALLGAALAVLLVACANLAALQATIVESRRSELSVRMALGAGARRLARQLLAESMLLSIAGGAAGVVLARAGLAFVPSWLPSSVPLLTTPAITGTVLFFAAATTIAAGLLLAAWPLAKLASVALSPRGDAARPRPLVYRGLVMAQVAATMALTVAAGLLTESLWSVRDRDPGFVIDGVTVADVTMPGAPTAREAVIFEQRILDGMATIAGVSAVSAAYDHPLEANWTDAYRLIGSDRVEEGVAQLRIVSPGYHAALGVEVLDGRPLTERDDLDAPGAALVNEAFARTVTDGAVIGRRLRVSSPRYTWGDDALTEFTIVGVVEDERMRGLEIPAPPAYYLSTRQFPQQGFTLVVRSVGLSTSVASGIRSTVRDADRGASVATPRTLQSILDDQLVSRRVTSDLIGGLSAAALALSALGVYGLLAVVVAGRTREIGVRIALGAPPARVGRQVVRESLVNGGVGVAAGVLLALMAGRFLESRLVGVSASDPTMLGGVATVILCTAAAAAVVPARRAARVDPAVALRNE